MPDSPYPEFTPVLDPGDPSPYPKFVPVDRDGNVIGGGTSPDNLAEEITTGVTAGITAHEAEANPHSQYVVSNDVRLSNERSPIDNSVTDAKIGDRTVNDLTPTNLGPGSLTQWLGWITNRIKAITGKANWWQTPATTLEAAATHASSTSNPHNLTAAQIGALTTIDWLSPGPIGSTTPNTGVFTTLASTGAFATKNINSTGTRIGIAPTSAPAGGAFRYDYTAGASIPLVSVGPSSNIQFGHGAAGMASAGVWNSGGSLALQYDVVAGAAQGNILLGTATNNAVDRLQVSGSGLFTGVLKTTDTTAATNLNTGSIVAGGGAAFNGAIFTPGMIVTATGALQSFGIGNGTVAGNARGVGAVDLQTKRALSTQVATGIYSFLCGDSNLISSGGSYSFVTGQSNAASGGYNLVAGGNNVASGGGASVSGLNNIASGTSSAVPGGDSGVASRFAQFAFASGRFSAAGDAQYSLMVARAQSTDATPKELFLNGSSQRITIANNSSLAYQVCISAHCTTDRTKQATFWRKGKIFKQTTPASTTIVAGELQEDQANGLPWTATISADTTNSSLKISFTGEVGMTINVVASVQAVEITG